MTEENVMKTNDVNPLLARAQIPGQKYTLPSLGLFYDHTILKHTVQNGEIYIHPLNTIEELTLSIPDKLFSGDAIRDVFKRVCPEVLNVDQLLAKDVDFILTVLQISSTGPEIDIKYDHGCKFEEIDGEKLYVQNNKTYTINISKYLDGAKKLDPIKIQKLATVTLENGQVVKVNPPRFKQTLDLYQLLSEENNDNDDDLEKSVISALGNLINSVDEITDNGMIEEWLKILRPKDINMIKDAVNNLSDWGVKFKSTIKCAHCGEKVDVSAEINPITFFLNS